MRICYLCGIFRAWLIMDQLFKINSVAEYCEFFGIRMQHPLVTVANFNDFGAYPSGMMESNLYLVMYKEIACGVLKYGRSQYDYQAGTLLFTAPGQRIGIAGKKAEDPPQACGHALVIHPDMIYGTTLAKRIKEYTFFSYDSNEALHMSDREKIIIQNCLHEIQDELDHNIDRHTKQIIASNVETLLNHCVRFYDRQFITREASNRNLMSRLDEILHNYYASENHSDMGIPSVQYCAGEICLSANYFGDLVKKETGHTAQEYIHAFVVNRAKEMLMDGEMNVSEIAYELGFRYPHHLTRVFKKMTGITPNEYRTASN